MSDYFFSVRGDAPQIRCCSYCDECAACGSTLKADLEDALSRLQEAVAALQMLEAQGDPAESPARPTSATAMAAIATAALRNVQV